MAALPRLRSPQPHFERQIHEALVERRKERDAERPRRGLYLSEIGGCPRKLWALLHGIPDEDPPNGVRLGIFALGESVESLLCAWLRSAGYTVRRQQERVTIQVAEGLEASGRLDGAIWLEHGTFDTEEAVLEIKSANDEQWTLCTEQGYEKWRPGYADTLHCYMGATGIHVAIVAVFNKNTSRMYFEKVRFDPVRFEALRAKAEMILRAESAPEKPKQATAQSCELCRYCAVASWCWSSTADVRFDP